MFYNNRVFKVFASLGLLLALSVGQVKAAASPMPFNKTAPVNGAINRPVSLTLSWTVASGAVSADSYEYCYDTLDNSACDGSWVSTGATTSASLRDLNTNTTYYWQARAVNNTVGIVYADAGAWWRFTTDQQELVMNGGFNAYEGGSKIPTYWVASNNFADTDGKDKAYSNRIEGTASVRIANRTAKAKTLTQTLSVSPVLKNAPFVFSYWVKGKGVMPGVGICQAQVLFYNISKPTAIKTLPCGFAGTFEYQKKEMAFTAPALYTCVFLMLI
jgi:hypothetical protein